MIPLTMTGQILPLGLFGFPQHYEIIFLILLAVVLFGPRLPKIARSIGQSVVEFKKGIKGVQDDIETRSAPLDEKRRDTDPPKTRIEDNRAFNAAKTEEREKSSTGAS